MADASASPQRSQRLSSWRGIHGSGPPRFDSYAAWSARSIQSLMGSPGTALCDAKRTAHPQSWCCAIPVMTGHRATDPLGDFRGARTGTPWEKEDDFVTAVSDCGVVLSDAEHQQAGDSHEDLVSDLVRVLVVDGLELVEINECA